MLFRVARTNNLFNKFFNFSYFCLDICNIFNDFNVFLFNFIKKSFCFFDFRRKLIYSSKLFFNGFFKLFMCF